MFQCPAPIINLPPSPPSHDWIKILISSTLGLLAGLIAEPTRGAMQSRINMMRMANAIRFDFWQLDNHMKLLKIDANSLVFWQDVELPAFNYYWEKNREQFYTNQNLQAIMIICFDVKRLRSSVEKGEQTGD